MPIECEIRDGSLVWIKNPITGVISYVVDVRGKSFAFTLGGRDNVDPRQGSLILKKFDRATEACPVLSRQRGDDDARSLSDDSS